MSLKHMFGNLFTNTLSTDNKQNQLLIKFERFF